MLYCAILCDGSQVGCCVRKVQLEHIVQIIEGWTEHPLCSTFILRIGATDYSNSTRGA